MKRRQFIKNSGAVGVGSLILNGIPVSGSAAPLSPNFTCQEISDRVLVMVNLFGANDTLNTVIPVSQYATYATNRPKLKIAPASTITLDNTLADAQKSALHPSMTAFKSLYDAGKLNVIHGVGYADNNRSHFKSDDLWNTAGDSTPANFNFDSGWAGQLFEYRYPGLLGSSSPFMQDPPCIELGATNGSILFNSSNNNNASILLTSTNVSTYYNNLVAVGGPGPATFPTSDHGLEVKYIDDVQRISNVYAQRIQAVYNAGNNSTVTYPGTNLANQLKTVARLIKGGSKSSIYMVHQFGYDTHGSQAVETNNITGGHANLLKDFTEAVKAFQDDITSLGFEDRVITASYSEFGRTIDENDNLGTDHGGVSTMFVIGKGVKPGVTGNAIDLTKVQDRALTDLQFDYRRVWASILQDFMGHGASPMAAARMQNFTSSKIPIIQTTHVAPVSCYINQQTLPVSLTNFIATLLPSGAVNVLWETSSEQNSKDFEIQHSINSIDWNTIGTLPAAGNSSIATKYHKVHENPQVGVNYYRLWQVDRNGSRRKYGPVLINVRSNANFVVTNYPNPAQFDFNVTITAEKKQNATIQFFDLQGHLLQQQQIKVNNGFNKFNYLTSSFKNYRGELIIHIRTEFNLQKTLRQIIGE
jgi:uncharacterized protein (DUF1501 family)